MCKHLFMAAFAALFGLTTSAGALPIHDAIVRGDLAVVEALTEQEPGVLTAVDDSTDLAFLEYLPLHLAVKHDRADIVAYLLKRGADPNARSKAEERTPFHVVATTWHKVIAEALLSKGADVNAIDMNGNTAMMLAVGWSAGNEDFVEYLLSHGADPKITDTVNGTTAFHQAGLFPFNLPTLKLFVEKAKLDVNLTTPSGATPLVYAAESGSVEMVRYLSEKGGDLNARHSDGSTLLILSAAQGSPALIEYLIDRGADLNAANALGETALHRAVYGSDQSAQAGVIKVLIAKGADRAAKTTAGRTAADLAKEQGKSALVEFLL